MPSSTLETAVLALHLVGPGKGQSNSPLGAGLYGGVEQCGFVQRGIAVY